MKKNNLWTVIFVTGVGISSIGDFIYLVVINVFVLDITHSATAVAGLWVISRIAALVAGPWVGSITDRFSRRKQLIVIEFCRAILISILPLLSQLTTIYVILFFLGVFSTFFGSVFLPYQTLLIPDASRKKMNAIISTLRYSAFLTGPSIAGFLLIYTNTSIPMWLDAVSFMVSALSFMLLPELGIAEKTKWKQNPWRTVLTDWREAFKFLGDNRLFTTLFILNTVIGIFALTADTQEVVFANQALHLGKLGYGMMVTAAGIGFVSGSLILAAIAKRIPTVWLIGIGTLINALGYFIYALSQSFWSAVLGLIILGIFGSASSVGFSTFTQAAMPVSYMGRINSVIGPPQQLLNILFIILGGVIASLVGVRLLMVSMTLMMSLMSIVIALVVFTRNNKITIEDIESQKISS